MLSQKRKNENVFQWRTFFNVCEQTRVTLHILLENCRTVQHAGWSVGKLSVEGAACLLTMEWDTTPCCIFAPSIFCNTLVGSRIFLLEIWYFQNRVWVFHFYFTWERDSTCSSPADFWHRTAENENIALMTTAVQYISSNHCVLFFFSLLVQDHSNFQKLQNKRIWNDKYEDE